MHWDEVSEYLHDALIEHFHIDAQDGSEDWTAKLLCTLYEDCVVKSDFTGLKTMVRARQRVLEQQRSRATEAAEQMGQDEEEGSEGELDEAEGVPESANSVNEITEAISSTVLNENNASSSSAPTTDADGWTTIPVKSKNKKR